MKQATVSRPQTVVIVCRLTVAGGTSIDDLSNLARHLQVGFKQYTCSKILDETCRWHTHPTDIQRKLLSFRIQLSRVCPTGILVQPIRLNQTGQVIDALFYQHAES